MVRSFLFFFKKSVRSFLFLKSVLSVFKKTLSNLEIMKNALPETEIFDTAAHTTPFVLNQNVFCEFLSNTGAESGDFSCVKLYFARALDSIEAARVSVKFKVGRIEKIFRLDTFKLCVAEAYTVGTLDLSRADFDDSGAPRKIIFANCADEQYIITKGGVYEKIYQDKVGQGMLVNLNISDCKAILEADLGRRALRIFDSFSSVRDKTDYFIFCYTLKHGGLFINHRGKRDFVADFHFGKPNGFCYRPDAFSSFVAFQFQAGHLFLQYLCDKIADFFGEKMVRKKRFDYHEFLERQMNVCHITSLNIESVEPAPENNDFPSILSAEQKSVFHKTIYDDCNVCVYLMENEQDRQADVEVLQLPQAQCLFIYAVWPQDVANVSLKICKEHKDCQVTLLRQGNVSHFWVSYGDAQSVCPDVQGIHFADAGQLFLAIAEFFCIGNRFRDSMVFYRQVPVETWRTNLRSGKIAEWKKSVEHLESCCEETKSKEVAVHVLLQLFEMEQHSCEATVCVALELLKVCRKWNFFHMCRLVAGEIRVVLRRVKEQTLCGRRPTDPEKYFTDVEKALCNEYIIYSAYLGNKDISKEFMFVANHHEHIGEYANVIINMKYYKKVLEPQETIDISQQFDMGGTLFRSSSTSIVQEGDTFVLNQRFVNYVITDSGGYVVPRMPGNPALGQIMTINKRLICDSDLKVLDTFVFTTPVLNRKLLGFPDNCEGIEDIKLFREGKRTYFLGTMCGESNLHMCYGVYPCGNHTSENEPEQERLKPIEITSSSFEIKQVEKNWSFIEVDGAPHLIYSWHPLRLLSFDMEKGCVELEREIPTPKFFALARGSTNTTPFEDRLSIAVVHIVDYYGGNRRHYYHAFVVLDANCHVRSYSAPFSFQGRDVEYCVGITCTNDYVVICYSVCDSSSFICKMRKRDVAAMLLQW